MGDIKKYVTVKGETISYREYGQQRGFPIAVHHGLLGSSLLPESWSTKANSVGARLIAVDRPGYGETSAITDFNKISDWGALVAPLLKELEVADFGSIAVSAGAPYAWSEANYFGSRVKKLWLLSAVPNVFDNEILDLYPDEERQSYEKFKVSDLGEIADGYYVSLKALQKQYVLSEGVSRRINAGLSNQCIGVAREAKMQVTDWGFDVYTLTTPMEFWHSPKDDMVPVSAVEKMILQFPEARLHFQEKKSHFPSVITVNEVFDSVASLLL